ncbi:c-type cytochrome domain-containing protein [Schlesneria sp. DSM 10557]|uniref:c-type cytochrome domain-containing protein n=1 Tax=Schlesneria sp. DSM 10557 TaxID=3044399 RepID=UPI0035A0725C
MQSRMLLAGIAGLLFAPIFANATEPPEFHRDVLPVLRKYCVGCHNPQEAEGGLVLQDYARTVQGGSEGPGIVAGKSRESLLWKRLTATDETRMPPKDHPAPAPEEVAAIREWIDAGAKAPAAPFTRPDLVTPRITPRGKVNEAITSVAFSPDGNTIALAGAQRIEIITGENVIPLRGHTGSVNEVRFSADGKWLCVAAGEVGLLGEATLWNTADWTRSALFQGHQDTLYSAQLSPDARTLATAGYDRNLIVWDVATGRSLKTFQGHNDAIYSASFSPNGKLIATASGDRTVKLWDVTSGSRLDTFSQPSKEQTSVAFRPDGKHVASGGADARIRIWQISDTGQEGTNPVLFARFAHEGPILAVVYSPDGRLLASTSEDLRIKIWETNKYTQVAVLERQPDWASALAFAPDNRRLLVGRMNGDHQIYPIDPALADSHTEMTPLVETTRPAEIAFSQSLSPVTEIEPNNTPQAAQTLSVPCLVQGELNSANRATSDGDYYRIEARHGDQFVFETIAARNGSYADTKLEIQYPNGKPVLRALLQAVRDSWINFRPIDSSSPDVRLEFWEEMDLNQLVYMNGEVCKTFRAPQGPDSGYVLYSVDGKRRGYFDTSAAAHAKDEPAYIVEAYPPDSNIVENGLPVFPVYYANDDDAERKLGKDSRILFTAPATGAYFIKVTDVRGLSGPDFSYQLKVRQPNPDFTVTVNTMNPKVPAGSGQRLKFTLSRLDHFDGPVRLDLAGLPKGFDASSPTMIEAGLYEAFSVLTASQSAPEPTQADLDRITILATAEINGRLVTKTIGGLGEVKLDKPGPVRVSLVPDDPRSTTEEGGLVIEPGTTITAKIIVERNGHEDDVRFDIDNLPHGIIVDNIGLSGVLVRKQETERQIFLTARPWVPETERLIHAVTQGVGNQGSPPVTLRVKKKSPPDAKAVAAQ